MQSSSRTATRVGIVLSVIPSLMLTMSAVMKLTLRPELVEGLGKAGFAESLIQPIGALCLACVILYVIPRTAVLGAILLTGYLGGAVVTHVRVGDAFVSPVVLGVLVWGGLVLRDPRLRELLPLRR